MYNSIGRKLTPEEEAFEKAKRNEEIDYAQELGLTDNLRESGVVAEADATMINWVRNHMSRMTTENGDKPVETFMGIEGDTKVCQTTFRVKWFIYGYTLTWVYVLGTCVPGDWYIMRNDIPLQYIRSDDMWNDCEDLMRTIYDMHMADTDWELETPPSDKE